MKPKSVENYTEMESEELFGDEMSDFDVCGTVFKELLGTFRLDYEYEIEYEYEFLISNQ